MFWVFGSIGFLVVAVGIYLLLVKWDAKHTIRAAPKEKMYVCDTHGAFLAKHALTLMDDAIVHYTDGTEKREPLLQCPFCFENRIKEAKDRA